MNCKQCGGTFEGRLHARYCSNACRQEAYRDRHSIERPAFLPPKKPENQPTRANKGLGNATEPIKARTPQERPIRPEWAELKRAYDDGQRQREQLYAHRATLVERCNKALTEKSIDGKVVGALGGAALGKWIGKDWSSAILCGLFAGYIGHRYDENQDADTKKRLEKLQKAQSELQTLDYQIFGIDVLLAATKSRLEAEPKYEIVEVKRLEPLPASSTTAIPVETKQRAAPVPVPEPVATASAAVMSAAELAAKKFESWPFSGEWKRFIGQPEPGFHMAIYGKPGQGKSTFAVQFANYLSSNHGKTLYISSEEGHSQTMAAKLKGNPSDKLFISEFTNLDSIINEKYPFIVIDSANHMRLTPDEIEQLKKALKERKTSLIVIHQATKDGELRGSQQVEHNADIVVQVDKGQATTTKNRYGPLTETPINFPESSHPNAIGGRLPDRTLL